MKLKIGFSTCPNDTYMFDALVNNKISHDFEFNPILKDVEELNTLALDGSLDVTKISYHAYAFLSDKYILLNAGSALGYGNGPILISKRKIYPDEISDAKIAIPGNLTTANLLLGIAFPEATKKTEYLFSDIEDVVLSNESDAGLIIHESRFTFEKKGLKKIIDLGEYWENLTNLPIPLGGIAIKREISEKVRLQFNKVLKQSIQFANNYPYSSIDYILKYSKELSEEVVKKHIHLYVNDFSLEIGNVGQQSVNTLFKIASEKEIIKHKITEPLFINSI